MCGQDTADCDSFGNHYHEVVISKGKIFLKEKTNREITPVCHITALLMKKILIVVGEIYCHTDHALNQSITLSHFFKKPHTDNLIAVFQKRREPLKWPFKRPLDRRAAFPVTSSTPAMGVIIHD